jgi:hypothetical protein
MIEEMDKDILQIACVLTMVADPWPMGNDDHTEGVWKRWLNQVAQDAGYDNWIDAYHDCPCKPNAKAETSERSHDATKNC